MLSQRQASRELTVRTYEGQQTRYEHRRKLYENFTNTYKHVTNALRTLCIVDYKVFSLDLK